VGTSGIRLFVMDVDGTLTDGTLTYSGDGSERKTFHARDGAGIKLLAPLGITPAIISGRGSEATTRRAAELGIQHVHQAVGDKAARLLELCAELGVSAAQAAFIGDDLSDIPPMRLAGWSAAPSDAVAETRAAADFVSARPGGHGAVREAIEVFLREAGLWEQVLTSLQGDPTEARA
jgi:3-deoxy-D-manno-octulosonate 8-phosphate phosphatase (KDO 8-P phosphatase)